MYAKANIFASLENSLVHIRNLYMVKLMHWADIICELQKAGSSLTEIAKEENVKPPSVSLVIRGKRTSHNIAYAISAKTGIPTERMWPGKYKNIPKDQADSNNQILELKEAVNG